MTALRFTSLRHRGDDVHVPQRVGPRVDVVKDPLLQRGPRLLVELPPLRRDVRGVVRLEFGLFGVAHDGARGEVPTVPQRRVRIIAC